MSKPKLFISHSTRHPPATDRCCEVRDHLHSLLKEQWDVFLDFHRVEPGDRWRPEILHGLARAQAGIILFNERAVSKSNWVRAEAMILSFRKSIDPNFQLVPVLFDQKKLSDTCFHEYEPFQLNEILALPDDATKPTDQLAQEIAACLDPGKAQRTEKSRWVTRVLDLLVRVEVEALKRAAESLDLDLEQGVPCLLDAQEARSWLAEAVVHFMHHQPPLVNVKAVNALLAQLSEDQADRLCRCLKAKWVENEAMEILICAARRPKELGLLAVNADRQDVIDQYFNRSLIEMNGGTVWTFSVSAAVSDEDNAILQHVEQTIRKKLVPRAYEDDAENELQLPAAVEELLKEPGDVAICALPRTVAKDQVLRELRKRFPKVIFLAQVGSRADQLGRFDHLGARRLAPPLGPAKLNDLTKLEAKLAAARKANTLGKEEGSLS